MISLMMNTVFLSLPHKSLSVVLLLINISVEFSEAKPIDVQCPREISDVLPFFVLWMACEYYVPYFPVFQTIKCSCF